MRFRPLRRFAADERGNPLVEFAFIAPVFFLLVIGAFELALVLFTSGSLQSAVNSASRYGATGQDGGDRRQEIVDVLTRRTFGMVRIDEAEINTKVYPSFASIGTPEPFTDENGNDAWDVGEPFVDINGNGVYDEDMGAAGLGGPGDIVLYQVNFSSNLITALLRPIFGEIRYTATVAVRNEPF